MRSVSIAAICVSLGVLQAHAHPAIRSVPLLNGTLSLSLPVLTKNGTLSASQRAQAQEACSELASSKSAGAALFSPLSLGYQEDVSSYSTTNTMQATCSFEPDTVKDVQLALKIIRQHRVPFAVRGGGHSTNAGFSSTNGVLISMKRFDSIKVNDDGTATIGTGLTFSDGSFTSSTAADDAVYTELDKHNLSVNGGRVIGPGAGLALGGGYGFRSSQYGLSIDTIKAWTLVLTNGSVVSVTPQTHPDLTFMLRGAGHSVGIVTDITFATVPSGDCWGGTKLFTKADEVMKACSDFDRENTDIKASVLCSYVVIADLVTTVGVQLMYDGPNQPAAFAKILAVEPWTELDYKTQRFPAIIKSSPTVPGLRNAWQTLSVKSITPNLVAALPQIRDELCPSFLLRSGVILTVSPEPFVGEALASHEQQPAVYSHGGFKPVLIQASYTDPSRDDEMADLVKSIVRKLEAIARNNGVELGLRYSNYAYSDTPLNEMLRVLRTGVALLVSILPSRTMSTRDQIAQLEAQLAELQSSSQQLNGANGTTADLKDVEDPASLQKALKLLDSADAAVTQIDGRLDGMLAQLDAQLAELESAAAAKTTTTTNGESR